MGVRASQLALLTGTALHGNVRVSQFAAKVALAMHGRVRASQAALLIPMSARRAFYPDTLDSSSVLYGVVEWDVTLKPSPVVEHNPYRASIPDSLQAKLGDDAYDYLRENQEILRQQHDYIQAGDSTFPVEMMQQSHTIKHFTLGSLSRFFHADYGIVHARYVQFNEMAGVSHACCPVGFFAKDSELNWIVTNQLGLSSPDLVVGIAAPWTTPADGTYGWVIVDGAVLQPVTNKSTEAAQGESFAWDRTGAISNTAKGRIIGRRLNKLNKQSPLAILAGQLFVCLESFSEQQLNDIVSAQTQTLLDSLTQLEQVIEGLPSAKQLLTLTQSVASLKSTLLSEISTRQAADRAINELVANLDVVSQQDLTNAVKLVTANYQSADSALVAKIDAVRVIALRALANARTFDPSGLQAQISAILEALYLESQRTKNRFPVVDGAVPPNLVYLDDGSLVYTETS